MDSNYTIDWSKEFSYRIYSSGGGEEVDIPTRGHETRFYGHSNAVYVSNYTGNSEVNTNVDT